MTVSELITFKGETDGASTTGDFTLKSDIIYGSISYIRIPAGMKAKIWAKRISGNPVTLKIYYTHDYWQRSYKIQLGAGYGCRVPCSHRC